MSEELTLKVTGMTCGGCESAIRRVLSMVEGVASASASHQAGEVKVVFDTSKTNRAAIERAIETAGYEVAA
jgi:copper chaperone